MPGLHVHNVAEQLDKLSFDLKIVEQMSSFRNLGMKN